MGYNTYSLNNLFKLNIVVIHTAIAISIQLVNHIQFSSCAAVNRVIRAHAS